MENADGYGAYTAIPKWDAASLSDADFLMKKTDETLKETSWGKSRRKHMTLLYRNHPYNRLCAESLQSQRYKDSIAWYIAGMGCGLKIC